MTPKHTKLEDRPELKGWKALYCMRCKRHLITLRPGGGGLARCYCGPSTLSVIHDLDEPCEVCIEESNKVRRLIRNGIVVIRSHGEAFELKHVDSTSPSHQVPEKGEIRLRRADIDAKDFTDKVVNGYFEYDYEDDSNPPL